MSVPEGMERSFAKGLLAVLAKVAHVVGGEGGAVRP